MTLFCMLFAWVYWFCALWLNDITRYCWTTLTEKFVDKISFDNIAGVSFWSLIFSNWNRLPLMVHLVILINFQIWYPESFFMFQLLYFFPCADPCTSWFLNTSLPCVVRITIIIISFSFFSEAILNIIYDNSLLISDMIFVKQCNPFQMVVFPCFPSLHLHIVVLFLSW